MHARASEPRRTPTLELFRPAALIAAALTLCLVLCLLMIGGEGGLGGRRVDRPHPWSLERTGSGEEAEAVQRSGE